MANERVCGQAGVRGGRAELTAGSIVVYSISDRWIVIGCRISSGDVLRHRRGGELGFCAIKGDRGRGEGSKPLCAPDLDLWLVVPLHDLRGKVL